MLKPSLIQPLPLLYRPTRPAPASRILRPGRAPWVRICPRCRRPIRRRSPRVRPFWRGGVRALNASGDVMLDDQGNRMLDALGNVTLDDAAGCVGCCRGAGCTSCALACTVTIFELKSNYPETCAEFWDIGGGCPGVFIGQGGNIERGGNLDSETFNLTPVTPVSAGVTCEWAYTGASAWTIDVYEAAGCEGSFCTIDMISVDVLGYGSSGTPSSYEVIVTLFKSGVPNPSQSTIFDTGFGLLGGSMYGLITPPNCPSGPDCNPYCFSIAADNSLVGHDACGHKSPSQLVGCDDGGQDIGEYDGGFCVLTLYNP